MCLILDANKHREYLNLKNADMQPIRDWVERGGRIAYSPTKKIKEEWEKAGMKRRVAEYSRSGQLKLIKWEDVKKKEQELEGSLKSNDPHIIALALVGKVKLLVSDDTKLGTDFKKLVKGRVYRSKSNADLLKKLTCP